MMLTHWKKIVAGLFLLVGCSLHAADSNHPGYFPTDSLHASWVFSGVVMDEAGDHYGYFFQMDREDKNFHVVSALFDGQNKSVILKEESSAVVDSPETYNWHVGGAFLRFNPMNDSWIFGIKTKDNKGFNFKVDMLKEQEHLPVTQNIRPGVNFLISQTGQLNGHIKINEDDEQFVTAKNAWFREVWLTNQDSKRQAFSGVLCYFNNGSGFYSVNMQESDAVRGSEAGWYDAKGIPTAISQFIHVNQVQEDGPWHIRIGSPNLHLILSEYLKQDSAIAGFIVEEKNPGFCLLSHNALKADQALI